MAKSSDIIQETGLGLGFKLNICKTEIFWSSCDGSKTSLGFFPIGDWETEVRDEVAWRGC